MSLWTTAETYSGGARSAKTGSETVEGADDVAMYSRPNSLGEFFSYSNDSDEWLSMFLDASNDSMANLTNAAAPSNGTPIFVMTPYSTEHLIVNTTLLTLLIISTIIGNILVIVAILTEKNLQGVANYLIMSLAFTDCAVSVFVMPLAVINEVSRVWFLGKAVCELFISMDVLLCTASILHLVVIALDRYLAVTRIDYIRNRTAKRIKVMIVIVWIISVFISIPPLFGWKDPHNNADETGMCIISQDKIYTVYSTGCAFYLPFAVVMVIYYKIWRAARSRIRKKGFRPKSNASTIIKEEDNSLVTDTATDCPGTTVTYFPGPNPSLLKQNGDVCKFPPVPELSEVNTKTSDDSLIEKDSSPNGSVSQDSNGNVRTPVSPLSPSSTVTLTTPASPTKGRLSIDFSNSMKSVKLFMKKPAKEKHRDKLEQKRERKAARTLAIITGCFCGCWFPFFVLAVITPFCGLACDVPPYLRTIINWLGYSNSLLNPVIYTIFSPDFRNAFRKILLGRCRR